MADITSDPNSRLGLLVAGYEKTLQELLTQIITFWRVRVPLCPPPSSSPLGAGQTGGWRWTGSERLRDKALDPCLGGGVGV